MTFFDVKTVRNNDEPSEYRPGGSYSSMIWVERAAETWKVDPFLYQILPKNETHFYTRVTNFKQNLPKFHIIFQSC